MSLQEEQDGGKGEISKGTPQYWIQFGFPQHENDLVTLGGAQQSASKIIKGLEHLSYEVLTGLRLLNLVKRRLNNVYKY